MKFVTTTECLEWCQRSGLPLDYAGQPEWRRPAGDTLWVGFSGGSFTTSASGRPSLGTLGAGYLLLSNLGNAAVAVAALLAVIPGLFGTIVFGYEVWRGSMAFHSASCVSSGGGEGAEQWAEMFGPGQIDQMIRQGIHFCWMALPKERRNADELEKQIRRILDRAIKDFREDQEQFGRAK